MSANLDLILLEFNLNVVRDEKKTSYAFEDYRLDAHQVMLYRGEQEVALPPKAVETLLVLINNQGKILTKEELIKQIWQGTVVEESNLAHYLSVLRKTLGDTHDGKPFIETLRRRGYRFNGEVRLLETTAAENGSAPPMEYISATSRHDVERHGNVLKVVDWHEAETPPTETLPKAEAATSSSSRKPLLGKAVMFAVAGLVVLLFALSLFWLKAAQSAPPPVSPKHGEMTVVRLTNGNAPVDATISPDGKYFVYHEFDGEMSRLWLQQTGQPNRIEILPPLNKIINGKTFSPDGAFVYFLAQDKSETQNSLYRVSTLGGAQTKILDQVESAVSFSPDGQEMIFHRWNRQTGESALVIAASDGATERILLSRAGQEGVYNPAWSPDGASITFFVRYLPQGELQGYILINKINLQTGAIEPLSPEKWATAYRMAWTHDGAGVVFVGTKYGGGLTTARDQIYYLTVATGEARRVTTDGNNRYQLTSLGVTNDNSIIAVPYNRSSQIWQMSADGNSRSAVQITNGQADGRGGIAPLPDGRVSYITRAGENLSLWLMNSDGTNQRQLMNDPPQVEELGAAPDGSFFVFTAERSDQRPQLFRVDTDGANLRQLTFDKRNAGDATISPDGKWIIYHAGVFEGGQLKHNLWKIPSAGGDPVPLGNENCYSPYFSPDGKQLVCARADNKFIIISATDGALLKTFAAFESPGTDVGARWTADGQNLVYIVHQKNVGNLWLQPLDGAAARPLTDFTNGSLYNFAFSPDGSRLYVARGIQINDAILIKNFR